jgi:hypothetical protein
MFADSLELLRSFPSGFEDPLAAKGGRGQGQAA